MLYLYVLQCERNADALFYTRSLLRERTRRDGKARKENRNAPNDPLDVTSSFPTSNTCFGCKKSLYVDQLCRTSPPLNLRYLGECRVRSLTSLLACFDRNPVSLVFALLKHSASSRCPFPTLHSRQGQRAWLGWVVPEHRYSNVPCLMYMLIATYNLFLLLIRPVYSKIYGRRRRARAERRDGYIVRHIRIAMFLLFSICYVLKGNVYICFGFCSKQWLRYKGSPYSQISDARFEEEEIESVEFKDFTIRHT